MFGSTQPCHQPESSAPTPVPQLVCREAVYTVNITNDSVILLSDIMKTVFNITLSWCDNENLNEVKFSLSPMQLHILADLCCRKNCTCLSVLLIS